ncbi:MAG: hypothetical protein EBV65_07005 [Gammaproteobacteria bacterium]|jgi:hypothetical protein|nr:hypothetical protein [Gammaproteobacteria bacterium]NBR16321.1 hypothetical protein [Gammaproteobacteria bacterium]NCW20821.1 hypothetical protein [Gammaproteobacteria bacterium]NCW57408.1 hypothetical protein [Gammaproteobacteria bacterium]NDB25066.1 hypothetical protein [Gammaproteobacteria bacterium]
MHESMLDYAKHRYLKIATALCGLSIVAYAWHDPLSPPNGGTWLGYILGGIGAALIFWLTALGVRKRSYSSSLGTLRGWTSAHVYLGLALIVVATLHTGFQFGWNLHTLCYVLMLFVIGSGIFGVIVYLRYPQAMSANRAGTKPDVLLDEINDLDQRSLRVASEMPRRFGDVLRSNRNGTRVGGSTRAILGGLDLSTINLPGAGSLAVPNPEQGALLDWLGTELARSTDGDLTKRIGDLLSVVATRRNQLRRLRRDAQIRGWLEIWLYVHVPVTLALIGTLIAHVVSVFLYW